jgi:hypothetical protein
MTRKPRQAIKPMVSAKPQFSPPNGIDNPAKLAQFYGAQNSSSSRLCRRASQRAGRDYASNGGKLFSPTGWRGGGRYENSRANFDRGGNSQKRATKLARYNGQNCFERAVLRHQLALANTKQIVDRHRSPSRL